MFLSRLGAFLPGALLLLAVVLADPAWAQETAQGVVFRDDNRNEKRDVGEPGVEGVSVSNGRVVVQTGSDGRYEVPVREEDIVFVTKPAGYAVPVDEHNRPQFYYIYDPDGTPDHLDLRYPGVEPTGPLPDAINFPLRSRLASSDTVEALVFADPQVSDHEELGYLRDDVAAELVGTDAAFLMVAGDLVNDDLSLYPRYSRIVGTLGVPVWSVPGNHDMNYEVPSDRYATETYKRTFGPPNYSFEYGDVHVVALDNVQYNGANRDAYGSDAEYRGYLTERQLEWLAHDLAFVSRDKRILLVTHIPLKTHAGDSEKINTVNLEALLKVLDGFEHVYAIAGHDTSNSWHVYLDADDGWTGERPLHHHVLAEVRGGAWSGPRDVRGIPVALAQDGNPNGYYILTFSGLAYAAHFHAASQPADPQMRILFEHQGGKLARQWSAASVPPTLVVNAFDGGPQTKVTYRIDDGPSESMTRTRRTDPFVEWLAREVEGGEAVPSSHVWTAAFPDTLSPGAHTVQVTVSNEFGAVHRDAVIVEIHRVE